jgi:predicted amidohydrolase YtcJ
MYWAAERLGPHRIRGAYAYAELMRQNGWIPNGTDFPIERIDPLLTFYAAVSRKDISGNPPGGFQPENALSRKDALLSITLWAARANFWDTDKGSLIPGKWADFVVLDKDILEIPVEELPDVNVLRTFVRGKEVFVKKNQ